MCHVMCHVMCCSSQVLKGSSSPETLATLRQSMCTAYTHLVVATRGILANVEDAQVCIEQSKRSVAICHVHAVATLTLLVYM